MYTRCPSCSSTFRLTAALLQMADGEVRCGSCGVVFNALHTLVDDWSGDDFTLPGAPRLTHPDEPLPAATPGPPATESLEFDVPENEWQRFFVAAEEEAPPQPAPEEGFEALGEEEPSPDDGADGPETETADDTRDQPALILSLDDETSDTDTWQAFLRETQAEEEPPYVIGEETVRETQGEILIRRPLASARGATLVKHTEPESGSAGMEEPSVAPAFAADGPVASSSGEGFAIGAPVSDDAADLDYQPPAAPETVLDWGPPPAFPERAPRAPARTVRWLTASLLATVLLGGQAAHYFRDVLAADPNYGPVIRKLYGRFGWPLYPVWQLDAYEIRDTKAIAERSAPGELDIVAEIAVTGPQAVGLPMLRVVLRDRWSNAIASGVFDPAQYLAEVRPASLANAPGTLIPVEITLKDPGTAAQGYELDVCVPNRKLGLQCKTARDAFRR